MRTVSFTSRPIMATMMIWLASSAASGSAGEVSIEPPSMTTVAPSDRSDRSIDPWMIRTRRTVEHRPAGVLHGRGALRGGKGDESGHVLSSRIRRCSDEQNSARARSWKLCV